MTVTEGEPVSMECRYSRKIDDRYLLWGYVPPGTSGIKQLLYWSPGSETPTYVNGNSGRYWAEKNFRRKVIKLRIARATQRDSSRYFCQSSDNLSNENVTDFCSCGTTLRVQAVPPSSAPSVELHSPFAGQLRENGTATLLCLASGFYPSNVRISWLIDGHTVRARVTQQPMCQDTSERYTAVSRLQLSSSTWMEAHRYQCTVTHPTLSRPIVKELRTLASLSLRRPTVRLIPPSIREMVTHQTATLGCVATRFIPDPITFSWMAQGLEIPGTSQTLVPTANEDGSYSARSQLTVALEDWESGTSYTCQVPNAQSDPKNRTLR
ncbi:immunoglobulin kappa light chain-like, partial [Rhincodon typus]|uniref:immunoglobulin kappa light chain-like n=1 Tax=Rhincodon typus TaxID=259920 RepID=UPI00202E5C03